MLNSPPMAPSWANLPASPLPPREEWERIQEEIRRRAEDAQLQEERELYESSLYEFLRAAWRYVDPANWQDGWAIEAMAEHLEAVVSGDLRKLWINIPPRCSKSSLVSVAFPAFVWAQEHVSPTSGPGVPLLHCSYGMRLARRDSVKCRRLINSPWYQRLWGHRVILTGDQNAKDRFGNTANGERLITAVTSGTTGEGGNIICCDDMNDALEANSEAMIETTNDFWDNTLSTRHNDPKNGAFVGVQQRLSQGDLTGHIIEGPDGDEWTLLMLPMRYEWQRHTYTSIGWNDPRGLDDDGQPLVLVDETTGERIPRDGAALRLLTDEREGELLWPERFGEPEVKSLERRLGPYGAAGQLQQRPAPKGGGIIRRDWWLNWEEEAFPPFDFIIGYLDTAYTEKTENDYSALTVWGVFTQDTVARPNRVLDAAGRPVYQDRDYGRPAPKVMLMHAWQDRLPLHELVEKTAKTCKRMRVDRLYIENKAAGISVSQEIRRLYAHEDWVVFLSDPKSMDKMSRLYSVQHLFAEGIVYCPDRSWADTVITQCEQFPRGQHDDLVDTVSGAMKELRTLGLLTRAPERQAEIEEAKRLTKAPTPLYPSAR